MTEHTLIRTPGGEELVLVPRAEYDALRARIAEFEEDEADVAAYDAAKAAMGDGSPRTISPDAMKGWLIRHHRKARSITQGALAEATGLKQGYISDLESGRRRGSAETIDKIADALGLEPMIVEALKQ